MFLYCVVYGNYQRLTFERLGAVPAFNGYLRTRSPPPFLSVNFTRAQVTSVTKGDSY